MIFKRATAAAFLLCLASLLGSCSAGWVADRWPHWAGGMPDDVPPRPGAPGYEEFIAHGEAPPDTTNSTAPSSTMGDKFVAGAAKANAQAPSVSPSIAHAAPAAPVATSGDQPAQDTGVVRGGLY